MIGQVINPALNTQKERTRMKVNVELPCELGTKIYVIPTKENGLDEITEMQVLGFSISGPKNVANCFRTRGTSALYQPSFEMFGVSVFFDKENAEKVLKEKENTQC